MRIKGGESQVTDLDNPLWSFALEVYPSLQNRLLALQDRGLHVNQVLFALWLGQQQRLIDLNKTHVAQAHNEQVVVPIREARLALKKQLEDRPESVSLYERVKQTELVLEQYELMLYWQSAQREHLEQDGNAVQVNLERIAAQLPEASRSEIILELLDLLAATDIQL